jgi:hypothetical protein
MISSGLLNQSIENPNGFKMAKSAESLRKGYGKDRSERMAWSTTVIKMALV